MNKHISARTAYSSYASFASAPNKTFYLAQIQGCLEKVSAKGFHKPTNRAYDFCRIQARDLGEAREKFFRNDVEWMN